MIPQAFTDLVEIGVVLGDKRALVVLTLARLTSPLPPLEKTRPVPMECALHTGIRRGVHRRKHGVQVDVTWDRLEGGGGGSNVDESSRGRLAFAFGHGFAFGFGFAGGFG